MRRLVVVLAALAGSVAHAQVSSRADAFAAARDATWAVAMLRMAPKGQIDQAAFVGTGFFVSRTHFITASHVVNAKLLGRSRNPGDQIKGGTQRMIATFNVTEGNSGSPVFLTSTGRVVAVQTSQATNSAGKDLDGYSISTPLSAIRSELEKLGSLPAAR